MTPYNEFLIQKTISLLRATPIDNPFRRPRYLYAERIETQFLIGPVENDPANVDLCKTILCAAIPATECELCQEYISTHWHLIPEIPFGDMADESKSVHSA